MVAAFFIFYAAKVYFISRSTNFEQPTCANYRLSKKSTNVYIRSFVTDILGVLYIHTCMHTGIHLSIHPSIRTNIHTYETFSFFSFYSWNKYIMLFANFTNCLAQFLKILIISHCSKGRTERSDASSCR
jgi:hypothetical protein